MKITNNLGLPQVFVDMANETIYTGKPNRFGATTLLLPAQEIVLRRRFANEMQQDVSDMINLFFGTAVHDYLERFDKTDYAELYLSHPMGEFTVSGKIDLFEPNTKTVVDYKTARVSKIMYNDYKDWRLQGLIYSWLLLKNGMVANKIKFIALLKDWSKFTYQTKNSNDHYYPEHPVYVYEQKVHSDDLIYIEQYIEAKLSKVKHYQGLSTHEILLEPLEAEYAPLVRYAVYANENDKRAKRVFDTKVQATNYVGTKEYFIKERVERNPKFDMVCTAIQYAKKIKEV